MRELNRLRVKRHPSKAELNEMFIYTDGVITHKLSRRGVTKGRRAGQFDKYGYLVAFIHGERFKIHRLIWIMFNGDIPDGMQIDHLNRRRDDNRIENLRIALWSDQARNRKILRSNRSGHTGVSYDKFNNKWRATIVVEKKQINLGRFNCIRDAISARRDAESQYGFIGE